MAWVKPIDEKIAVELYTLPVDKEELRLIKLALFEISEYLGSPKLAGLRQRVNSLMGAQPVKLPTDSIFNNKEFQSEWANSKLETIRMDKLP
jgi:hypothetical protein